MLPRSVFAGDVLVLSGTRTKPPNSTDAYANSWPKLHTFACNNQSTKTTGTYTKGNSLAEYSKLKTARGHRNFHTMAEHSRLGGKSTFLTEKQKLPSAPMVEVAISLILGSLCRACSSALSRDGVCAAGIRSPQLHSHSWVCDGDVVWEIALMLDRSLCCDRCMFCVAGWCVQFEVGTHSRVCELLPQVKCDSCMRSFLVCARRCCWVPYLLTNTNA